MPRLYELENNPVPSPVIDNEALIPRAKATQDGQPAGRLAVAQDEEPHRGDEVLGNRV